MSTVNVSPAAARWLRIVAAAEAGPAVYLLIASLGSAPLAGPLYASVFLYAFLASSIYFGVSLLKLRRSGVIGSIAIQVLQLLLAENDFFTWRVQLAGFLGPALSGPVLGPNMHLGPLVLIRGSSDPEQISIGVNVLAIGAIALLAHALGSGASNIPPLPERSSA